ncbi:MAG: hypothetical protein HYX26_01285 [Acidobacteriales bacterium]|nr:hypothetical protein [Terriglobales bacterium]
MNLDYSNEQDTALALLQDSTATLRDCGVDFVIVGGWVPFLFHATRFGHPGTFDVDVLLNSSSLDDGTFDAAAEQLLSNGYLRAVKNKFQAHRILRVGNEKLVFHVDFLNERNPGDELDLIGGSGKLQSIYTPAMQAVFKYAKYRMHSSVPGARFPSVETFIAGKAMAAEVKKRQRDAFDVFVTIADLEPSFRSRWKELMADGLFRDANDALSRAVHDGDALDKINSVLDQLSPPARPSRDEIRSMFDFLLNSAG